MLDPTKKDTSCPRAKPQQDGRRGEIMFKIKPHTSQRYLEDSNKTLCATGCRDPQRLSQTCLWVFECLLQRHRPAVACCGDGLWLQQTWDMQCVASALLEEVAISATIEPPSRQPKTAELLYQRNPHTVRKILGPTRDFPTWGSGKGTGNHQGISLWRPVGFDYKTSIGLGKQTPGGHKQNLVCTRTQEKGTVIPSETEPDLPVSGQESLVKTLPAALSGHWTQQSWTKSFWRRLP